ncbi:MAG: CDC27 family protein [Sulfurimonas sp.]|nr:CDC27 family protein [Sulfurimonas sp.]
MLNVNDLELKHKRYKQKLRMPYIIIFTSLSIIIISIVFFYNNIYLIKKSILITEKPILVNKVKKINKVDINDTKKVITNVLEHKKTTDTSQQKEIIIENDKFILLPSFNFLKKIQTDTSLYYKVNNNIEKKPTIKKEQPIIKTVVKKPKIELQKEVVTIKNPEIEIEKKTIINIEKRDTNDDIYHVIKRFKVNNSPALSLFIAKKYYQLQEYDKSYNYALITNKINNNIEASWIIFSKSLVKLNKKDMAIKTLQEYINHSHSSQARLLLDEIISGKFK